MRPSDSLAKLSSVEQNLPGIFLKRDAACLNMLTPMELPT